MSTATPTATPEFLGQRRVSRSAFAVTEGTLLAAYMATCDTHSVPVREDVAPAQATTKHRMITCFIGGPGHEHLIMGERLVGVVTALECDGSCRGARGRGCSCGCGGVNHGNTWTRGKFISSSTEYESALAKYRAHLAKLEAARVKRFEAKQARQAADFALWTQDPKISALVTWLDGPHPYVGQFLADMMANVQNKVILSENMITACRDIYRREAQRARDQAARNGTPARAGEVPAPRASAADLDKLTPGVYKKADAIFVVKGNKAYLAWRKATALAVKAGTSTPARPADARVYAMRLTESAPRMTEAGTEIPFTLEIAKGAIWGLSLTDMMPRAEAEALSTRYARCIVCGRHLKAAKSVREAIGPVCGAYFRD